jgi:hypothetical protein
MDLKEQLRLARVEREKRGAEAKARRDQQERSEVAYQAWEHAANMARNCFRTPEETIPIALDAIQRALNASEQAGELSAVRRIASDWQEQEQKFTLAAQVAGRIVNEADRKQAATVLDDAAEACILSAVAEAIEAIGEMAWHGAESPVTNDAAARFGDQHPSTHYPPETHGDSAEESENGPRPTKTQRTKTGVGGRPRKWAKLDKLILANPEDSDDEIARRHNAGSWSAIKKDSSLKANAEKVRERRYELSRKTKPGGE